MKRRFSKHQQAKSEDKKGVSSKATHRKYESETLMSSLGRAWVLAFGAATNNRLVGEIRPSTDGGEGSPGGLLKRGGRGLGRSLESL